MINDVGIDFQDEYISSIHGKYFYLADASLKCRICSIKSHMDNLKYFADLYVQMNLNDKNDFHYDFWRKPERYENLILATQRYYLNLLDLMELKIELHFRKLSKKHDPLAVSGMIKKIYLS